MNENEIDKMFEKYFEELKSTNLEFYLHKPLKMEQAKILLKHAWIDGGLRVLQNNLKN